MFFTILFLTELSYLMIKTPPWMNDEIKTLINPKYREEWANFYNRRNQPPKLSDF